MRALVRCPAAAVSGPRPARQVAGLALALLSLVAAAGCTPAPSGLHAVHDDLGEALPGDWQTHLRVSAGRGWSALARTALAVAGADPLARTAARAVGDFKLSVLRAASSPAGGSVADALEPVLHRRGWERNVVVKEGRDAVAVYTQPPGVQARRLSLCVWVGTERELVLVTAQGDLEAVAALVGAHLPWTARGHSRIASWPGFTGWREAVGDPARH